MIMQASRARAIPLGAWLILALALTILAPMRGAQAGEIVGNAAFVVGQVEVERGGKRLALGKTHAIREGDWIRTGPDGHVHLRMIDQGFIAVRPVSRLHVRAYTYRPDDAAANRVQLHLESGVARTVSGRAGEASKARYRFNTPHAAIGLRGTDYVVQALDDVTRVSVLRGAVIVSPMDAGCGADTLGPCNSVLSRELNALTPHAYIEVRLNGGDPQILLEENGAAAPNRTAPPRPEEPQANLSPDSEIASARLADAYAPVAPPSAIAWGRWSQVPINAPTVVSQMTDGREITYGNELFGLLRTRGQVTLPGGEVGLRYAGGEAWLRDAGGQLHAVPLRDGLLDLDFNARQFQTSLTAQTGDTSVDLRARGAITFQGMLIADPARSSMNMNGVVSNQAQEAGYVFDRTLSAGTLYGVTHWKR
jgi:hypothetical protein